MIMEMGMQECDSFEEEDINDLEAELLRQQGPQLSHFSVREEFPIVHFLSKDIIKAVIDQEGRDIKMIGNDKYSQLHAFFYILLLLGVEERRNYPHLNTLIKEQFYKPNIFHDSDQSKSQTSSPEQMLEKSLKYFEEISEGTHIQDYFSQEPIFEEAGIIMLKNSVEEEKNNVYEQLATKFNIDMKTIRKQINTECYLFGVSERYYIFRERDYFFVATTEVKEEMGLSKYDLESVRSEENQFIIEPSQKSTPKFKNSEARFSKKIHKNSFGGDHQNFKYKDLVEMQAKKYQTNFKVFSEHFEPNELQSCTQNMIDIIGVKNSHEEGEKEEKQSDKIIKTEMKGSTTLEPVHAFIGEKRKDRKIASSQILQHHDYFSNKLVRHDSVPQVPTESEKYEEHHTSSFHSLKKETNLQNGRLKGSLIQNQTLERIDQLQSSQKESTHPDQESERSSEPVVQNPVFIPQEIQVKMKDRKYSYFTQQMASSKSKQQKQIESSNYVFKLPKPHHKNSEVILPERLESQYIKRRFEENPLRFSQLGSPSEESVHGATTVNRHNNINLKLNRCVFSYFITSEPENWIKKEVIYHLPQNRKQVQIFQRPSPQSSSIVDFSQTNYTQYSHQVPSNNIVSRTSFGSSSNSQLSKKVSLNSYSSKPLDQISIKKQVSPCEINEESFLNNRIKSLTHLIEPDPPKFHTSKHIMLASSQSLKQIRVSPSPPKINFSYQSSASPKSVTHKNNSQSKAHYNSYQYLDSQQSLLGRSRSPPFPRPQTCHPDPYSFENRFFRK